MPALVTLLNAATLLVMIVKQLMVTAIVDRIVMILETAVKMFTALSVRHRNLIDSPAHLCAHVEYTKLIVL